ncbi:hypothetical protein INR49_026931 [Caranx melampygus]|nr:hypothetical protein INR49_002736 [Caranx melampygus]KAG7240360.1 hypothetical protein INR49_026931 [Caranx melampygus]
MAPAPRGENLSAEPQLRSHCKSEGAGGEGKGRRGGGGVEAPEETHLSLFLATLLKRLLLQVCQIGAMTPIDAGCQAIKGGGMTGMTKGSDSGETL